MQKIGEQIKVEKSGQDFRIEIYPSISKKDKMWLTVWLMAWSFCGLAVVSQLFFKYTSDEKIILVVYLVLWAYFELKVIHAFRWQKSGKELVEIKDGKFSYTQLIGLRGLPVESLLSDIKGFRFIENSEKGFLNDINRSVWMLGGEVLEYEVNGALKRFGLKLPKQDALKLIDLLNKQV